MTSAASIKFNEWSSSRAPLAHSSSVNWGCGPATHPRCPTADGGYIYLIMSCGNPGITTIGKLIIATPAPQHHNSRAGQLDPLALWRRELHQHFQKENLVDTRVGGRRENPPALCQFVFPSGSSDEASFTTTPEGLSGWPGCQGGGGPGEQVQIRK